MEVVKDRTLSFILKGEDLLALQRAFQIPVSAKCFVYRNLLMELTRKHLKEVELNGGRSEVEGAVEGGAGCASV